MAEAMVKRLEYLLTWSQESVLEILARSRAAHGMYKFILSNRLIVCICVCNTDFLDELCECGSFCVDLYILNGVCLFVFRMNT